MDLRQLVMLAFLLSILCTVFGFGLRATLDDVLFLLRRPALLGRSLLAMFVLVPMIAVALAHMFGFRPEVEIAIVALALSPVPPLLPMRETKAGGTEAYALGLMVVLSALAIVTIPLSLHVVNLVFGRASSMAPWAIGRVVLVSTLLPLAAGMIVRVALPAVADRIARPVALVATVLLPLAAVALLFTAAPGMWVLIGNGTLVALVTLAVAGFAVGHVMGGPEPDRSTVLAFSSACRHPAIALSLATANFPGLRVGAAIILYILVSGLVGVIYVAWRRQRATTAVSA
jgi:BASS family bile acid:Na+ symporter